MNPCTHLGRPVPTPQGRSPQKSWYRCELGKGVDGIVCPCECSSCPDNTERKTLKSLPLIQPPKKKDKPLLQGNFRKPNPERTIQKYQEVRKLAPKREQWIKSSMPDYPVGKFKGRGAVILGGGKYESCAYVAVHMLRDSGWEHPIEIWYRSHEETISPRIINLPGVTIRDTASIRADGGWQSKMVAIINSQFEEVLFLDADCYPVVDPNPWFGHTKNGWLIWEDHPGGDSNLDWPAHMIPSDGKPSIQGGQYVIKKRESWNVMQLAAWIDLHSTPYYKFQYGDQDSVRVAAKRLGFEFDRVPRYPGMLKGNSYLLHSPGSTEIGMVHRHNNKLGEHFNPPPGYQIEFPKEAKAWAFYFDWLRRSSIDGSIPDKSDPPGWMSENELKLLAFYAKGKRVLELGRFCGLSTSRLTPVCSHLTSIDALDASFTERELDRLSISRDHVRLLTGSFSEQTPNEQFDMVFVDGHHDAINVKKDLSLALSRINDSPSDCILVHDYGEKSVWPAVKQVVDFAFNKAGWKLQLVCETLAVFVRA